MPRVNTNELITTTNSLINRETPEPNEQLKGIYLPPPDTLLNHLFNRISRIELVAELFRTQLGKLTKINKNLLMKGINFYGWLPLYENPFLNLQQIKFE